MIQSHRPVLTCFGHEFRLVCLDR